MDISILLPSISDVDVIKNLVNIINESVNPKNYKYEIVIVTDKVMDYGENVVCTLDKHMTGSISACNEALLLSSGEWILSVPDGVFPPPNMFSIIEWMSKEYKNKKYKISSFSARNDPPCQLSSQDWFCSYYCRLNPKVDGCILRYPCGHRDSFKLLGDHFFNPSFKHRVADNWLGIFLTLHGETSMECPYVGVTQRLHKSHKGNNLYDMIVLLRLLENYNESTTYGQYVNLKS